MTTPLTYRNRDGELVDVPTVAATQFKNEFGAIFERAALGGAVAITKHNTPKAVLLSYAEFEALYGDAPEPLRSALVSDFLPKDLRCLKQSSTRCIGPLQPPPSRLTRGRRTAPMPPDDGCRQAEV